MTCFNKKNQHIGNLGPTRNSMLLSDIKEHLRLRRKGNAVQLVWETNITEGKIYSTLISEVCITDIPNQRKGDLHDTEK